MPKGTIWQIILVMHILKLNFSDMNRYVLYIIIFLVEHVNSQELISYKFNDLIHSDSKSKFFISSLRAGGDINYQFRSYFTNENVLSLKAVGLNSYKGYYKGAIG